MEYPHKLSSLSTREAITDALYRAIIGFDRNDVAIFDTAFAGEDVHMELRATEGTRSISGLSKLREAFAHVVLMDTTHTISNVRVSVQDGADTASMTCYALAQHCPRGRGAEPNGPKYMTGGEYWLDLIKDREDGLWKIRKWVLDIIWRQGDSSVMQRPE